MYVNAEYEFDIVYSLYQLNYVSSEQCQAVPVRFSPV